jgi:hypothetical protein
LDAAGVKRKYEQQLEAQRAQTRAAAVDVSDVVEENRQKRAKHDNKDKKGGKDASFKF